MSSNGICTAAISFAIMVAYFEGAALAGLLSTGLERLASPATFILGAVAGLAAVTFRPTRG